MNQGSVPARVEAPLKPLKLTPADRREIGHLLERFVPWAVGRERPGAAYDLATPALQAAASRWQWRHGVLPVMPYPARAGRYRQWTLNAAYGNEVDLDVLIPPRVGVDRGPLAANVVVRRRNGGWRVDSLVPDAVFSPPGKPPRITANPDYGPQASSAAEAGRLSAAWLLVPAGLLLLPVGVLLALSVRGVARRAAVRRAYGRSEPA